MIKTLLKNLIISAAALLYVVGYIQPVYAEELSPTAQKAVASGSFDVFIDENNDVCIVTNDQKRTSNIYYRSIGFTIAEGQFDPSAKKLKSGAATPSFAKPIDTSAVTTYAVQGREVNIFRYPFAEIRSAIAAVSGEWDMEIEQALHYGKTAYIRFDCVMIVNNDSRWTGHYFRNDPPYGPYDDEARDLNPKEIQGAEPWRAGSRTGLRTHYHRWLAIGAILLALGSFAGAFFSGTNYDIMPAYKFSQDYRQALKWFQIPVMNS